MSRTDNTAPLWVRAKWDNKECEVTTTESGRRIYDNIPDSWWKLRTRQDEKHFCHNKPARGYVKRAQKRKIKSRIRKGEYDLLTLETPLNKCFRLKAM